MQCQNVLYFWWCQMSHMIGLVYSEWCTCMVLSSGGIYLNSKLMKENRWNNKFDRLTQLFDLFNEQRRLNFRRLILLGLVGFNSQMNGIRFRQSNIFHDFDAVSATQPRRVSSLKRNILESKFEIFIDLPIGNFFLRWIIRFPSSVSIAFYWDIERINKISFLINFIQSNERMSNGNFHWSDSGWFI